MSLRAPLLFVAIALAFAAPAMAQTYIEVTAPPPGEPPIYEVVPEAREGYVWAPGYYDWEDGRYVWVTGQWLKARPDYVWVEANWHNDHGHIYYEKAHWAHTGYDPEEHRDWRKDYQDQHEPPRHHIQR